MNWSAATSHPRSPRIMMREPSIGRPRTPSARLVRCPARPSAGRCLRRWKRRTAFLVPAPERPSTAPRDWCTPRSATWSAATLGLPPRARALAEAGPGAGGEERHASWLELFFDLVFVVAIAELAQQLVHDHSLGGFAIFAGLFLPVFIAWQGFTFYADRFDTDDVLFRAVMLAAMLAIAALAVQIPDVAAGRHDAGFVVAHVTLRPLLVALYLRAWPRAAAA